MCLTFALLQWSIKNIHIQQKKKQKKKKEESNTKSDLNLEKQTCRYSFSFC